MDERWCEYCFETLVIKPYESAKGFEKRRFCDKKCAAKVSVSSNRRHKQMGIKITPREYLPLRG